MLFNLALTASYVGTVALPALAGVDDLPAATLSVIAILWLACSVNTCVLTSHIPLSLEQQFFFAAVFP